MAETSFHVTQCESDVRYHQFKCIKPIDRDIIRQTFGQNLLLLSLHFTRFERFQRIALPFSLVQIEFVCVLLIVYLSH